MTRGAWGSVCTEPASAFKATIIVPIADYACSMARRDPPPDDRSRSSNYGPNPNASGWREFEGPEGTRRKRQLIALGVIGVIVLLFIVLNSRRVETQFIFFSIVTPLWVGFLISVFLGVLI